MTISFIDTDGKQKEYPQSFTADQTRELFDFIKDYEHPHCTMIEVAEDSDLASMQPTVVRHDIDHSIDHALKMAHYENKRGITSSYYVLHTAWYFRDFENTMEKCREIIDLGHEVGIHMDACSAAMKFGGSGEPGLMARNILEDVLARMHFAGVTVRGSALHGGEGNNTAFWEHYDLKYFGLEYEAYQMHRDLRANYISDNRGVLRKPLEHIVGRPTHLLMHPEHWSLPS